MSSVVLLFFGIAVAAPAQAADPAPSPYPFASPEWVGSREWIVLCTGFDSCKASGYSEGGYKGVMYNSFWRQSTGHNCTNYVAYRLVQNGLPNTKPSSLSGNAFNWGPSFPRQTDSAPAVGSVAWWDTSFSSTGHVAYVEKVISPDEILISEDNWGGDFRWRRVTRGGGRWPQGFIHLKDVAAPVATPADYQSLAPTRLLDTRSGLGAARAVVPAGGKVSLQVAGRAGLPTRGVGAVVLNVTAVTPGASGFLSLYPTGTDRPVVSSLNYQKGSTIANQVVAKVGDTGAVDIYASQTTHLVVDVSGYYTSAGYLQTVAPTRLADSRYGLGTPRTRIPAGTRRDISVVGVGGVPASGASSVVLNVTAVTPGASGF
ncbi:MAG: CHAP domain-containing protein, partial [Terracoccus sp.]